MTVQEPPKSKKTNPTIWVIVAVLLILICCVLVALVLGGTYLYLQRSGKLNNGVPALPFLSTPKQVGPGAIPTVSNGALVVEPFDPTSGNFPALPDLVPNWSESTKACFAKLVVDRASQSASACHPGLVYHHASATDAERPADQVESDGGWSAGGFAEAIHFE